MSSARDMRVLLLTFMWGGPSVTVMSQQNPCYLYRYLHISGFETLSNLVSSLELEVNDRTFTIVGV